MIDATLDTPMPISKPGTPPAFSYTAAFIALVRLSLARHLRGKRPLVLGLLFLLPAGIVALARSRGNDSSAADLEFATLYNIIPHALAPLAALIYASGMIRDESEDQTLTYLLMRPLPRWAIYLGKLAATLGIVAAMTAFSVAATLVAVHWGEPTYWWPTFPVQAASVSGVLALAVTAYVCLFGMAGMFLKRVLVVGVAYLSIFEGVIANIPFVVRQATINYHFRVLCARWLDVTYRQWAIDLSEAPTATTSLLALLTVSAIATTIAAASMTWREMRVKTPEGN
ncbi:ABC transporter permease subunit [Isosphaeraceae bacterium EP7]